MANEFIARNGIIANADSRISGTLNVSGDINMGGVKIATESYVTTAIANLTDSAPDLLNTLNELAAALGDDPNFATTVTNNIATKLPLAGGTMSGNLQVNAKIGTIDDTGGFHLRGVNDVTHKIYYNTSLGNVWEYNAPIIFQYYNLNSPITRFTLDNSGNLSVSGTLSAAGYNKSNWDTAFGWGNNYISDVRVEGTNLVFTGEGGAYNESVDLSALPFQAQGNYLTDESDTLASVVARGSVTNGDIRVSGTLSVYNSSDYGLIKGYSDNYHGMVFRGYPTDSSTLDVTAADVMSFYEYGGEFAFYQKNSSGTLKQVANLSPGAAVFRTYASDNNYNIRVTGGDQFNAYYGDSATTMYVNWNGGQTRFGGSIRSAGTIFADTDIYATNGNGRIYLGGNLHIDSYGETDIYLNFYSNRYIRTYGDTYLNNYVRINKDWSEGDYGAEQFTIRGTYPSIALRSTTHDSKWLIHHASELQFYHGGEVDNNLNWGTKLAIPTNGDIWMSWANDNISNLLAAKQNASTAITTSNIGSQSVSNADTVDGYHASAFTQVPTWTSNTQSANRSNFVSSGNWYRIANLGTERFFARVRIYDDSSGGPHSSVEFQVAGAFNYPSGYSFNLTSNGYYAAPSVTQVRILSASTYEPQYLEVYISYVGYVPATFVVSLLEARNASVVNWEEGSVPDGYSATTWNANAPLAVGGRAAIFNNGITVNGSLDVSGNINATGVISQTFWTNDSIRKLYDNASLNFRTAAGPVEMILDGSGNLGVGNTSPDHKLHVSAGVKANSVYIGMSNNFTDRGGDGDNLYIRHPQKTSGGWWGVNVGLMSSVAGHTASFYPFRYLSDENSDGTEDTTWAYIDKNGGAYFQGNVGIGTDSPGAKLTVAGSAISISNGWTGNHDILFVGEATNSTGAANSTAARIRSTASAPGGAATGDLRFTVNSGDTFVDAVYIAPTGNVGINTTTPQVALDVNGYVGIVGSNYLYFGHSTSNIGAWTTRQYSSGSTHYHNAVQFIFNNEGYGSYEHMRLTYTGMNLNGKQTIDSTDSWLRLNQAGDYGSGVYTPGILRSDGLLINYGGGRLYAGLIVEGNTKLGSGSFQVSTDQSFGTPGNYSFRDAVSIWNPNSLSAPDTVTVMSIGSMSNGVSLVATGQINASGGNSSQWNTAYSWGNHAAAGYTTTTYVDEQVAAIVDSAPDTLNTLKELSNALGDDQNFATNVTNSIAAKVSKSGDTMTGNLTTTGLIVGNGVATGRQPYGPLANANIVLTSSASDSSGVCGIEFYSGNNYPSDGASIYFENNTAGGGSERAKLTIRVENDQEDHVEIRAGKVVLNANTYSGGGQDPSIIFQHNSSDIASISSNGQVNASGGNSSQWNSAYSWGNHAGLYIPINPDGDGPAWEYSDANPTINGTYIGGRQSFGADGDAVTGGALQARLLNAYEGHVNSTYGYYVGTLNYGGDSEVHETTQVINSSGTFVGPSVSTGNVSATRFLGQQGAVSGPDGSDFPSSTIYSWYAGNNNHLSGIESGGMWHTSDTQFRWYYKSSASSAEKMRLDVPSGNLTVVGTVAAYGGNSTQWNTAYGWGNHANYGYWNTDLTEPKDIQSTSVRFVGDVEVQGTFTESSSIRFKENIKPLEPTLGKVEQLNPVTYNKIGVQEEEIGLIAEEVAQLFPEVVTYNEEGQASGIQYQRLSVILLKAVQELTDRVNKLENK